MFVQRARGWPALREPRAEAREMAQLLREFALTEDLSLASSTIC